MMTKKLESTTMAVVYVARGNKPKTGSTSSQQSVSLPVNEEKRGSKRASSSVADKPPKKLKKGIIDLTENDEQNIDADLGRVIAKVSGRAKPTTSAKDTERKKEKKKDKKRSHEESTSQKDNVTQDPPEGASNVEELKESKKKKKSKKVPSNSTTAVPNDSTSGKQIDPQGAIYETTKNPSQDKISGPNNESSNSCLQPPPNKMPVSTIPETLEEDHSQETPITEHASKGATLEEISTADSPPKGNPEENRQASPSIVANNQMKEDSPKGNTSS
ncbi:hypothetical protein P8452_17944 [Trifolium repens]|nr:hypothetical protein P8452_17944 [Trifolium repens]